MPGEGRRRSADVLEPGREKVGFGAVRRGKWALDRWTDYIGVGRLSEKSAVGQRKGSVGKKVVMIRAQDKCDTKKGGKENVRFCSFN